MIGRKGDAGMKQIFIFVFTNESANLFFRSSVDKLIEVVSRATSTTFCSLIRLNVARVCPFKISGFVTDGLFKKR